MTDSEDELGSISPSEDEYIEDFASDDVSIFIFSNVDSDTRSLLHITLL